jgi:hypothetical protein
VFLCKKTDLGYARKIFKDLVSSIVKADSFLKKLSGDSSYLNIPR